MKLFLNNWARVIWVISKIYTGPCSVKTGSVNTGSVNTGLSTLGPVARSFLQFICLHTVNIMENHLGVPRNSLDWRNKLYGLNGLINPLQWGRTWRIQGRKEHRLREMPVLRWIYPCLFFLHSHEAFVIEKQHVWLKDSKVVGSYLSEKCVMN